MGVTLVWTYEHKKAGHILEIYIMGEGDTIVNCEHPTIEEYTQTVTTLPVGSFCNFKIYPLANFNVTMRAYIESLKQTENLFPITQK